MTLMLRLRIILMALLLFFSGLSSSALAQDEVSSPSWFMKTGKTSRGAQRLPMMSAGLVTTTSMLIMMKVESYPETAVKVGRPSPFDLALNRADLRANMLFDLTVVDLINFRVSTRLR